MKGLRSHAVCSFCNLTLVTTNARPSHPRPQVRNPKSPNPNLASLGPERNRKTARPTAKQVNLTAAHSSSPEILEIRKGGSRTWCLLLRGSGLAVLPPAGLGGSRVPGGRLQIKFGLQACKLSRVVAVSCYFTQELRSGLPSPALRVLGIRVLN